jgi:pimeloyl-ACP methyl ester carboxylesterase
MDITFKTATDEVINGTLLKKPSKELIIVCHGYKGSRKTPALMKVSKGLYKEGYSIFAFDFPEGSEIDIPMQVATIAEVFRHFDAEYDEFVLLATSFGALSASIAAIRVPNVTGLITINGFFGQRKLGKEFRKTYIVFRLMMMITPRYRKVWSYFKRELQPSRLRVPTLVIHSKADAAVSIEQSRHFFEGITSPKEFSELETANHRLSSPSDVTRVIMIITNWLKNV